jgi:predicted small metal-binding protein
MRKLAKMAKPNHNTATRISEDLLAWIVERIV